MAARDPTNLLVVPGRLVISPTDLSAAYPYGGTELGIVRDHVFRPNQETRQVVAEEFGGHVVEEIVTRQAAVFAAVLHSWDAAAIPHVLGNAAAGDSGRPLVSEYVADGTVRAGQFLSERAVKLLFVPEALRTAPAILLFRAAPMLDSRAALELRRNVDAGLAVLWRALPDDTLRVYQMGALEDLTL